MSELTNAKRIARDQARINDLMDLLREKPTLTYAEILNELAKLWGVSPDTVTGVIQYAQRKKLVVRKVIWNVQNGAA